MSHRIGLHHIAKAFGSRTVLDGVSLLIDQGSVTALLGASGCGKTTLLRIIAGLEQLDHGEVRFSDGNQAPQIGMVFQQLGLWPHLTCSEHLECVLSHQSRDQRRKTAARLLVEVGLPEQLHRARPSRLSGGEAQRLALARALACEPGLLLLDEPLAHLDAPLRHELLMLVRCTIAARGITAIYVTHSASEAAAIAEQVAVLHQGRIAQQGTIATLYWRPCSLDVARLTGPLVRLPHHWFQQSQVSGDVTAPLFTADGDALVRPQQISITSPSNNNRWSVARSIPLDGAWLAKLYHTNGETWELPVRDPLCLGQDVGVAITSISAFEALALP